MPVAKALSDAEILRFARLLVTETGAATFTQTTHDTQLSIDRGVIWLIHNIDYHLNFDTIPDIAAGATGKIEVQVSRESKSAIIELDDADCIDRLEEVIHRYATIGTDAGPAFLAQNTLSPIRHTFDPPIPYASQNIYLGILSGGVAQSAIARIAYTIQHVSEKYFWRVAQALLA